MIKVRKLSLLSLCLFYHDRSYNTKTQKIIPTDKTDNNESQTEIKF